MKHKNPYVPKEIHVDESKKVMVVKWDDGTETKVTCDPQDNFSIDVGFGMAFTEHMFGGKREFKEKWWKIIQRRIKYHGKTPGELVTKQPVCFSCETECDSESDYCYGCENIVCVDCSEKYDHQGNGLHGHK